MVKGNSKKLFFYLLAFSFFINMLITAYAEEPVKPTSRKVLLFFETDKAGKWLKADLLLLYDSLLIKLVQECKATRLFEAPVKFTAATSDADKSKLALRADCDAWLVISIKPVRLDSDDSPPTFKKAESTMQDDDEKSTSLPPAQIIVRSYDLMLKQEVVHLEWKAADGRKIERLIWEELAEALNRSYKKINQKPVVTVSYPLPEISQVTVKAAPGTVITGLTDRELLIDKTGKVHLELFRNRTYTLQATCENYFPLLETLYPADTELNHTIKQQRTSHWATSLYLQNLCYPGLEATYFLNSHTWYLRASLSTFLIGLPEWIMREQTAEPVVDFTASTGLYFFKPDNFFRFYTSLGCFFRLIARSQSYLIETNNLALLFGVYPVGGMEISPYTRLRFYVEYTPLFYLHPSLTIEHLTVELLAFNLGIRVLL